MYKFRAHPATISVGDGIQDAFGYLQASWRTWLPVVAVVGAATFVLYSSISTTVTRDLYYIDPYTNQVVLNQDAFSRLLGGVLLVGGLVSLLTLVGTWVFTAIAIAGLRNRPLTLSWVVMRGLVTVVSGLVIAFGFVFAVLGLVVAIAIATSVSRSLGGLLAIVVLLCAIPLGIYVGVRLALTSLAIFDGFGPIAAIQESWRLSQRSVLRLVGWGLMAGVIAIGFAIVATVAIIPLNTSRAEPLAQAISTGISTTGSCLIIFMMAALYESQRCRSDPRLFPYAPGPTYPGQGPAWPYPYGPGPAYPGQYPAGPYPASPVCPGQGPAGPYPYGPGPAYPGQYLPGPYPYPPGPAYPGQGPAGPYPGGPAYPGQGPAGPVAPSTSGLRYENAVPRYADGQLPRSNQANPSSPASWPVAPNVPPAVARNSDEPQASMAADQDETAAPDAKPTDPPASSEMRQLADDAIQPWCVSRLLSFSPSEASAGYSDAEGNAMRTRAMPKI